MDFTVTLHLLCGTTTREMLSLETSLAAPESMADQACCESAGLLRPPQDPAEQFPRESEAPTCDRERLAVEDELRPESFCDQIPLKFFTDGDHFIDHSLSSFARFSFAFGPIVKPRAAITPIAKALDDGTVQCFGITLFAVGMALGGERGFHAP
jgi:hypothetical protein